MLPKIVNGVQKIEAGKTVNSLRASLVGSDNFRVESILRYKYFFVCFLYNIF